MTEYFREKFGMDYHVSWMITWRCSLNCEYCGAININRGLMKGPEGGSLTGEFREKDAKIHWKDWVNAFNRLPGNALIDISGGEPFIYPNILDIIEGIDERHKIAITTNLTLSIEDLENFIKRIHPRKISQITCSLHLCNKEWNTLFIRKLDRLFDAQFMTQVNFVAYPSQLSYIPRLFNVLKGVADTKNCRKIEGEVLPIENWKYNEIKDNEGNITKENIGYYSCNLTFYNDTERPTTASPTYGIIYKNNIPLPFNKLPERQELPCYKIEDGVAFLSTSGFDRDAKYIADYYIIKWKEGLTDDEIKFHDKHRGGIGFYLEPYSGGAVEAFEGYTDEEITLLDKYWQKEGQSIVRKKIRDIEGKAVGKGITSPKKRCNAGQHKFMIAPDGLMYPCNVIYMKRRDLCMGDFLQIYLLRKNPIFCNLPCTCGGDVENLIIEYI